MRDALMNTGTASSPASATTPAPYCNSTGLNNNWEWIEQVDIGEFSNSSGAQGYSDFTGQIITLSPGTHSVALTPGFGNNAYNEFFRIWIDLNLDGDFADAGEELFSGSGFSTVTGSLTIPDPGKAIETRLRVSMQWANYTSPCGSFQYGEVEDYTLVILD
jgi:hypothetical protein